MVLVNNFSLFFIVYLAWILLIWESSNLSQKAFADESDKKKANKWKSIDFDGLEKEWESGDDPELLEHEIDRIRRVAAQKQPKIDMNDPNSIRKAYNENPFAFGGGGGQMVFLNLKKRADGSGYPSQEVDFLAKKWASLMRTGGLLGTCFNTGDNTVLINLERGWTTKDVLEFAAQQPEVESMTAQSKTYTPAEILKAMGKGDDDDDDD